MKGKELMNYESLGERIRRLRHSMNVTQDTLAEQLGISASFLGHLERGSRKASLDTLVGLCNSLRVSPEYLLADSLDSDVFPSARKLSPRQQTALKEIVHVIESTIVDWAKMEREDSTFPQDLPPEEEIEEAPEA